MVSRHLGTRTTSTETARVYRASRLVRIFLSRRRVAARSARRARRGARLSGARAARSRRRLRRAALPPRREEGRPQGDHRRGADDGGAMRRDAFEVAAGSRPRTRPRASDSVFRLPVLIESQQGYRNLCRLLTMAKLRAPKGEGALTLDEIDGHTSGLIALGGRAMLSGARFGVGGLVDRLVGVFGRDRHLPRAAAPSPPRRGSRTTTRCAISPAAFHVPILATNGVRFAEPADRPLYDVLTCIRHKTTLAQAGRRLSCNAERYLKSPAQMGKLFADIPEALAAVGRARRSPRLLDGRSRLPLSGIPGARRGDDGVVPAEDHAGRRARALPADRAAPRAAARARAGSRSRSSISPATSSSSGTS